MLGAECNPTEPGCRFRADCPEETVQTRSCINFCVPVWPGPASGDTVGSCALDECDEATLSLPSVWRCPESFACLPDDDSPDPASIGRCRATPATFLTECAPSEGRPCSTGTFCMPLAECPDEVKDLPGRWSATDSGGICLLPAREGELCDGNLADPDGGPCRPCEHGTFCRDTTSGAHCLRPCVDAEDPSVPQPDLCDCDTVGACDAWATIAPPDPEFDVLPGEPEHYCSAQCVVNGSACERTACCDPLADCADAEDLAGRPRLQCCRPTGETCASDDDCCNGFNVCLTGTCTSCAREGEFVPNTGCCPGFAPIGGICRSCAVSPEGRDLERHGACEGHFVEFVGTDGRTDTFAVPRNGTASAGSAEMPNTGGDVQLARYQLADDHRLFLLQGDLTSPWDPEPCAHPPEYYPVAGGECSPGTPYPAAGVTVGHRFVQLPANFPGGGAQNIDLSGEDFPPSTWESMRVYDSGACSIFLPWQDTAHAMAAGVSRSLVSLRYSSPLTLMDNRISPILANGSGIFARGSEHDQMNVFFEFVAQDGAGGCGAPTRIRFDAGIRVRREPALLDTAEAIRLDRSFVLSEPVPCRSPVRPVLGSCVETCGAAGDHYNCNQFFYDASGDSEDLPQAYPRPARYATDAYDFVPETVYLDAGVVDCALAWVSPLLSARIESRIRDAFPALIAGFTGRLRVNALDTRLTPRQFWRDLVDCGEIDDASGRLVPNAGICSDLPRAPYGGRRHYCVGYDDDHDRESENPTQFRCGEFRIEVRRVNIRPDGIEFVFAEDPSDPQLPLVQLANPGSCLPGRAGSLPATNMSGAPRDPLHEAVPGAEGLDQLGDRLYGQRWICAPGTAELDSSGTVIGCSGICGDIGVPCAGPYATAFRWRSDVSTATGNSRLACYVSRSSGGSPHSTCCHPVPPPADTPDTARWTMCPWPVGDDDARQLLNIGSTPVASDFYSCRNVGRDPNACGACGVVCEEGWGCCDSTCLDIRVDDANCGRCNRACGTDRSCVAGTCECDAPLIECAGLRPSVCIDPLTDPRHCGGCGRSCGVDGMGNPLACVDGRCRW